jgi:rubrerythrin
MVELFTHLREWEEAHIKRFQLIRSNLEDDSIDAGVPELSQYVQALIDKTLYQSVIENDFYERIKTSLDAINYAIRFEKDSILLFLELKPFVSEKQVDIIDQLIMEERNHIVRLINLRRKVLKLN